MKVFRMHGAFPLLRKELIERANQWRTYLTRAVFALLLSGAFLMMIYGDARSGRGDPFRLLGRGRQFFEFIVVGEFIGIFAFVPALLCGVIAQEKERRSLPLLLVTDLRPDEILLQKFAGGLLPVLSLLLVSLPLLAIAYAFGGIPVEYLAGGVTILLLTSLQVAAIALCMSSFCRTSVSAFIATYVCGLFLYFGPIAVAGVTTELLHLRLFKAILPRREESLLMLFPPYVFFECFSWRGSSGYGRLFVHGLPILGSILVFLYGAYWFLVRRAFVRGRNAVMLLWDRIDVVMEWLNGLVNDILLVPDRELLPEDEPVAWLAVHKRALGKVRYLFRVFVALEVPTAFLAGFSASMVYRRRSGDNESLGGIAAVLWAIAALSITVYSSSLFASERWRNTLDVLLTTPMRGADIVREKMKGTRRLLCVLAVPIVTVVLFEAWWEWPGVERGQGQLARGWSYLALSSLWLWLFFPLLSWVSVWVGLKTKGRFQTTLGALGLVGVWLFAPVALAAVIATYGKPLRSIGISHTAIAERVMMFTPTGLVFFTEFRQGDNTNALSMFLVPAGFYLVLLVLIRWRCLRRADEYLGRLPESEEERDREGTV